MKAAALRFVVAAFPLVFCHKLQGLLDSMQTIDTDVTCVSADGTPYIVPLLNAISKRYFKHRTMVILYDDYFYFHTRLKATLDKLLLTYEYPYRHARINTTMAKPTVPPGLLHPYSNEVLAFLVFTKDSEIGAEVVMESTDGNTYVILISQTSVYSVKSFLRTKIAAEIANLLILVDPAIKVEKFKQKDSKGLKECDILLFSHELVSDSLASSHPVIITAWRRDHFTRQVPLFPSKYQHGLGGKHLVVAASEIPPFVFRKQGQDSGEGYTVTKWDGLEVRLMDLVSSMMNLTVEYKEPDEMKIGQDVAEIVIEEVVKGKADGAVGGIYLTAERTAGLAFSMPHTQDCASFISLSSTALPKYRAIMGPFLWDVWLALVAIYLFAMFPIAFSVWHTIKPLLNDFWEVENMFWYVFGTFTNCFTFVGKNSWGKSEKNATKLFIGTYWVFTIIITACYTGSIVAFITLPVFPETIDSSAELLDKNYKISVLDSGNWYQLFNDTEDPVAKALNKSVDTVPDVFAGLKNVTKNVHQWRQSAFLGSRRLLEHFVRTNFTPDEDSKKLMFHMSAECFVPLMVSFMLPKRTPYMEELNNVLERAIQAGYMKKIAREMEFAVYRSASGKLLRVHKGLKGAPEDRELTLDDTQGMFLLLGAGFAIAIFVLTIEIVFWARGVVRNRQFGQLTLKERIVDKLKEHGHTIYEVLLAPASKTVIYLRERRVSSAFGEYVTRRYSDVWEANIMTVQSPTPPKPQQVNASPTSAPAAPDGDSLYVDDSGVRHQRPTRLLSF
ncbi:Ligand-gated ion channel [Nesidiocoris tenuis]|uniref:Ligand-gated ion channel n=1 Tax=Nesidiocoris tenuis TaxID=355587 RepID=A0ABN7AKY4_9HEMI|nr:Ligand-gated ion channel [Nesidiocoris tenuis]